MDSIWNKAGLRKIFYDIFEKKIMIFLGKNYEIFSEFVNLL
jgi:hypothetical protein